jgi:2-amino-4-hydroxy-6-hydroxymethyldihydropteridine diphosphokinase
MHWYPAYVGIGSNLHDPPGQVRRALAALAALPATRLVRTSRLYGSQPLGPVAQPDFCNAVAALLTQADASGLHASLRSLELQLGREPTRERWGPRVIDLDLLVYADLRRDEATLTLPHPGIAQRSFVLQPLCDVAPDLQVPGLGRVAKLAAAAPGPAPWVLP